MDTEKELINVLNEALEQYEQYGPRSNKKVMIIHKYIENTLKSLPQFKNKYDHSINNEQAVESLNYKGSKKCDVVIRRKDLKRTVLYIFPIKFITSNYKQNRNNYLENLVGESYCLKKKNPLAKIIPINIFRQETPYLDKNKNIKKLEKITYDELEIYKQFKPELFDDVINYIIIEKDNKVIGMDEHTPYRCLKLIVTELKE
jgi:hypothetical protein